MELTIVTILINVRTSTGIIRDFSTCHDDLSLKPADGILKENTFTWLGFLQYLHVTTGLPHHSRAPRVILLHRQFMLGAATDLLRLPNNYKLGNIVFGNYDRDEIECGLTQRRIRMGETCRRAYLEMPLTDTTPHPEYTRFGVGNSLALVKLMSPLKSAYTIPVCLPSYSERMRKRTRRLVFMVDYMSTVPRDFDTEKLGKKTVKLYTHQQCRKRRKESTLGSEGLTHVLCSSGCGVRPGAPIVSHNLEGQFELIGVAVGGTPCLHRSMRRRLNSEPPIYIDVYPYVGWLVNVITAYTMPMPYPQNFRLADGKSGMGIHKSNYLRKRRTEKTAWRGRTFVSGRMCFKKFKKQEKVSKMFYWEIFQVNANPPAKVKVLMKISAGIDTTIVCARLMMPNRLTEPKVLGIGGYNISVEFGTGWFPESFSFQIVLTGTNTTMTDKLNRIRERKPGFW